MNNVAIVTGGTRGIGAAISTALRDRGFRVAATYHGNDEAANAFKSRTGVSVYKWDVGDYEQSQAGVERVTTDLGTVSVLVNNAGITRDGMLHKMDPEHWNEVLRTNLTSCFNMSRILVPSMRERGFGRIVSISSINGQKGQIGQTNYAAAKAGIIGFTKALALECAAKGITVNAIAPGYVRTEMLDSVSEDIISKIIAQIPVGRLGRPEEVAELVGFLTSPHSGFVTGATFAINGGQYML
ncbi:MAG TPA: acetoacetyl-CoA reductase [Gammaproteobacteria bacterium]|nr:acetoacetyl-CoA reductase [Gammaproteobacteria bacterium]